MSFLAPRSLLYNPFRSLYFHLLSWQREKQNPKKKKKKGQELIWGMNTLPDLPEEKTLTISGFSFIMNKKHVTLLD